MRNIIICLLMGLSLSAMGQGIIKHDTRAIVKSKGAQSKKSTGAPQNPVAKLLKDMVHVQGGTYTMGATAEQGSDAYEWEYPTHRVTVSSFYICKYEVTQALWKAIMGGKNPSCWPGDKRPVECVSWTAIQTFIQRLNARTGKHFRLPTEEEWEWAARGGTHSRGYKYSGSNDCTKVAWHHHNSKSSLRTYNVGTKLPNELGLYDMSGNVREVVSNAFLSYKNTPRALVTNSSDQVTIRGGHFWDDDRLCRVSYRTDMSQEYVAQQFTGFRLAASSL